MVIVLGMSALLCLPAAARQAVDFAGAKPSADAAWMGHWITDTADNQGMPFVIVDKKGARIFVFDTAGRLVGDAPALLGLAPGDYAVPGIGQRELSQIRPFERTTPAGRFVSVPGRNLNGEQVIWVDYNAGLAIHRVRTGNPEQRRPQRLASASVDDNRISLGCVVVTLEFFENVVHATLGKTRGVIYVLPESSPVNEFFASH